MGIAERRVEIMRILYRRRYEKISNLAQEFGVSERTILRDIESLSITEPIYTQCGKYGGVYVMDEYNINRMYMKDEEIEVLHKLLSSIENKAGCDLDDKECNILKNIISQYTKPKYRKEIKNDQKRN